MELPDIRFYLFGMGGRRKLLYKGGVLKDALSGETINQWDVAEDRIIPEEYTVEITVRGGKKASIVEDEKGVFVVEGKSRKSITEAPVNLPRFESSRYAKQMRILHQELLVNVLGGKPVPNFFVYKKPWYRDAAMTALCFQMTGNVHVIADWIRSISEPFDKNNAGVSEPDNLGQLLYLCSLVSNTTHPVVDKVLEAAKKCREGKHIIGKTDFGLHPVYQTKWLKLGVRSIGLPDYYEIPKVKDSYSALFWMDYKDQHVPTEPFSKEAGEKYPYLVWAEAHFHGWPPDKLPLGKTYPLTWEAYSSEAVYANMAVIDPVYAGLKLSPPHTWHAAEAFLYYLGL